MNIIVTNQNSPQKRLEQARLFPPVLWFVAAIFLLCGLVSCAKKKSFSSDSEEEGTTASGSRSQSSQENSRGAGSISPLDLKFARRAVAQLSSSNIAASNTDTDSVQSALTFPATVVAEVSGEGSETIALEWKVSHSSIDANGQVNRPLFGNGNVVGSIQVVARKGAASAFRTFPVTVLQFEPTDSEAVAAAKAALNEDFVKLANASLNRVQTNLRMPSVLIHGTTVSWTSTLSSIASNGAVNRPAYNSLPVNPNGNVTATITKGNAVASQTFNVRVMRQLPVLMITEVASNTVSTEGFVEVLNTSATAIDLSEYQFWTCDSQPTCSSKETQTLPAITLAPGAYVQIKPRIPGDVTPNSTSVISIDSFLIHYQIDYFELVKAGVTVDFIRWRNLDSNLTVIPPVSGMFSGIVKLNFPDTTKSVGRIFPYEDSDNITEWISFPTSSPGKTNGTGAPDGSDSDADGLTDEKEVSESGTNPFNPDSDGDGFSDGQEWLTSGVGGLNIRALGADPLVRDVFVEVDYMASPAGLVDSRSDTTGNTATLELRKDALKKVKAAFEGYVPTSNDANPFPIKIHFDTGALFDPEEGINPANFDLEGGNQVPFSICLYLGTDVLRNATNCANLYDLKQSHFSSARQFVFHYMVIGWSMEVDGTAGSSGLSEIPGNDSIVTIGSWGNLPEQMIVNWQAATIMHELGHNFGLDHGGYHSSNYKANYVSSMNYLYQLNGLDTDRNGDVFYFEMGSLHAGFSSVLDTPHYSSSFEIGFSRGSSIPLNESSVSEQNGIGGVPIDFNGNGVMDSTLVSVNIQPPHYNTSSTDYHRDFDDWANLKFSFQNAFGLMDSADYANFNLNSEPLKDVQPVSSECQTSRIRIPIQ